MTGTGAPRILAGTTYRGRLSRMLDRRHADAATARLATTAERYQVLELTRTFDALPTPELMEAWARVLPDGLVVDVRAFRLLSSHDAPLGALGEAMAAELAARSSNAGPGTRVSLAELPGFAAFTVWELFRASLEPLRAAGRLGCVIFVMPPWFHPGLESRAQLATLAERLPGDAVAVELGEGWLAASADGRRPLEDLAGAGLCYAGPALPRDASGDGTTDGRRSPVAVVRADRSRLSDGWVTDADPLISRAAQVHLFRGDSRAD